jgi:hypothetical protein
MQPMPGWNLLSSIRQARYVTEEMLCCAWALIMPARVMYLGIMMVEEGIC